VRPIATSSGDRNVRDDWRSVRTGLRALTVVAAVSGLVGCAPPINVGGARAATNIALQPPGSAINAPPRVGPVTIQVRDYPPSPIVSVFGWAAAQTTYGLSASVRRDGALIGDHQLYVNTYSVVEWRDFTRASAPTRPFRLTGASRDPHNCHGGGVCSPVETFGARIPDAFLRTSRDSLTVKFSGRSASDVIVTVHRNVIDAYLAAFDSVTVALRKK
jgi:hypothetical protein